MAFRPVLAALLLMVTLSGCTGPDPGAEVVRVAPAAVHQETEYQFILFGDARVTTAERQLDLVVKHNNRIVDVVAYTVKPDDDRRTLKTYLLPEGVVRLEVVEDRNVVLAAQIDPEECPDGRADAIVQVEDRRYAQDGSIEIDYGCSF